MKMEKVEKISFGKGMMNMATDSDGALGGLLTIWKESLEANIIFDEGNILLINFFNPKDQVRWFLLNLYAPNTKNSKRIFWTKFFDLVAQLGDTKGIFMRDFNISLLASEKLGGLPPDVESRQYLADLIRDLALLDVDLGGCKFTWSNRRIGSKCI